MFFIFVIRVDQSASYYVVIFTSVRSDDVEGYDEMDKLTFQLVEKEKGYLGAESFSNENGRRVTIVKFKTEEDILRWKNQPVHQKAQILGRERWYRHYNVKICKVEREYEFNK